MQDMARWESKSFGPSMRIGAFLCVAEDTWTQCLDRIVAVIRVLTNTTGLSETELRMNYFTKK
jgi:hypothetical protein